MKYLVRVLLTGIWMMRTGEVQANLPALNQEFNLTYISDLIEQKRQGPEKGVLKAPDMNFFSDELQRLTSILEQARESTHLPEKPQARKELSDLLVRLRLSQLRS